MPFVFRPTSVRVSCLASLVLALSCAAGALAGTNDLDVARQALRDGFWSLARTRAGAAKAATPEARQIVLESWAREGKWDEVLRTLSEWNNPTNEVFAYYRALSYAKKADSKAARDVFAKGLPADPVYRRLATRLLADLALGAGQSAEAVRLLQQNAVPEADDKLLLADAKSRLGERKSADLLWKEVAADTNATVRARATAVANLGDEVRLRAFVTNDVPADIRTLASLRLGELLLRRPATFDEGAKLIRETATRSPDAEGACEASRLLADARLRRGDWKGAATGLNEIMEIWPEASRLASVQEGLGWALLNLGRPEDALQAFRRAEAAATTEDERAMSAAKASDALMALGRVDEATDQCRAVLSKWPKAAVSKRLAEVIRIRELELRGRKLYREFRFADAQKAFAEVGAADATRRGRMAFFEVLCLYGQGRDAEAEVRARTLVRETKDLRLRADVAQWLARAAYNAGRWREAKELFTATADSPLTAAADAASARVWAARASLAANDFTTAIALAAAVVSTNAPSVARAEAQIVQGEALIELARFDEAVLVFERAALLAEAPAKLRLEAQILRADALYAMGADNPARYEEALADYRAIGQSESVPEESRLVLAYKIGLSLEKLKRRNEATDQYYAHVVLAYRDARLGGRHLGDEARAVFARAAFRLADLCEASGHFQQAQNTLRLVAESDVPAAAEARKRLERLRAKGDLP